MPVKTVLFAIALLGISNFSFAQDCRDVSGKYYGKCSTTIGKSVASSDEEIVIHQMDCQQMTIKDSSVFITPLKKGTYLLDKKVTFSDEIYNDVDGHTHHRILSGLITMPQPDSYHLSQTRIIQIGGALNTAKVESVMDFDQEGQLKINRSISVESTIKETEKMTVSCTLKKK